MISTVTRTDEDIRAAVVREIFVDLKIDTTEVQVKVCRGSVTLTGTVSNFASKCSAQMAAHHVMGVAYVTNMIQLPTLSYYCCTDAWIRDALSMALELDISVPHTKIHITVADCWVKLSGEVPSLLDRLRVETMVYSLDCIVGLENNITIDEKAADAHRVKRLIESMWDGLGRFGADRLVVELNGAAISVSGTVRSLREKQMVLGAAACANGALKVEDRIYINPD